MRETNSGPVELYETRDIIPKEEGGTLFRVDFFFNAYIGTAYVNLFAPIRLVSATDLHIAALVDVDRYSVPSLIRLRPKWV